MRKSNCFHKKIIEMAMTLDNGMAGEKGMRVYTWVSKFRIRVIQSCTVTRLQQ